MLAVGLLGCIASDPDIVEARELVEEVHALVDTRYALFVDKDVDWDAARDETLAALDADPESFDAEEQLVAMLETLRDGHVNLATPTNVSVTRAFLEERVPTWDADLVQRHVLDFDYSQVGSILWAIPDSSGWGYLRVDDFRGLPSSSVLDVVFEELAAEPRLVLDLRSNGGGSLAQAGRLLARFIDDAGTPWHLQFSTGPAHDDLSEPNPRSVEPRSPGYRGRVLALVDGRTYSAANVVAFGLATLDDVTFVGAPTGGGAGSPTWHELSLGWALRFPTIRLTGPDEEPMEDGLPVDIVSEPDLARPTVDAMIEAALAAP